MVLAAKDARALELVWRAAAGVTDPEGCIHGDAQHEPTAICIKSKPELLPHWNTILTQKEIFSLSPNSRP